MSFKSPAQRKYIFKVLDNKKKGINPIQDKSPSKSITAKPQNISIQPIKMKNPSAIPALPGLPKPAKFAKMKKFFK